MSADVCLYCRIFEDAVTFRIEGTVFEFEVIHIAEQLFAFEVAVDEAHVLGVPCQILSIELRVIDRHVLTFPE